MTIKLLQMALLALGLASILAAAEPIAAPSAPPPPTYPAVPSPGSTLPAPIYPAQNLKTPTCAELASMVPICAAPT